MKRFVAVAWLCLPSVIVTQTPVQQVSYYVSLNYLFSQFPEPSRSRVRFIERTRDGTHIPMRIDLGYLRHFNDRTLVGFVNRISLDRYSNYGNYLQFEFYEPAMSVWYFLDEETGSGIFVRGDAGPTLIRRSSDAEGTEAYSWGYALMALGGYAIEVRDRPVTISVGLTYQMAGSKVYHSVGLGIGSLF